MRWKKAILRIWIGLAALFALIQLVPYGRGHENPPLRSEPAWDAPRTRELAVRACYDCHSNDVCWPWYSHVAPVSWLVEHDVDEGREDLNFSEWDRPQKHAGKAAKETEKGKMPPWFYSAMHRQARLSPTEMEDLSRGLRATLGEAGEREHESDHKRDGD
ncbi:MAG: heme-binding domain-containing protein [Planctomycetes bacterium]|nr:heme-binding domain-containing protein [Planctomycetota bacterium]